MFFMSIKAKLLMYLLLRFVCLRARTARRDCYIANTQTNLHYNPIFPKDQGPELQCLLRVKEDLS